MTKVPRLAVVLDGIRSVYNVGSVLRLADGLNCEQLIFVGSTPLPQHPKIAKTALGAESSVDWQYFADRQSAQQYIKKEKLELLCLELTPNATNLSEFKPEAGKGYALVLGSETDGVHEDWLQAATETLFIPMHGVKDSLNVSTAAAIAMWHLTKLQ